jgi:phosphoglucosamine mutase
MKIVDSADLGKAERIKDAQGRYIEFCKSTIPSRTVLHGLKIVVDCANGATYHIAPHVFEELGAEVIRIGTSPNGLNINEDCGATSPQSLSNVVLSNQAHIGIALDGDGDRLIMVDHKGEIVDGDEALYIIAKSTHEEGRCSGGVVGTLMSNLGLELALKEMDIPFERAAVGDRYVMELLKDKDWMLGGESSGHIICLDRTSTGDGIVAALQILYVMTTTGKSLHELKKGMTKMPQTLINVPMARKLDIQDTPAIKQAVADVEATLGDEGRVLLRPSGTEPLVRVMVEGKEERQVRVLAQQIADAVSHAAEAI